MLLPQGPSIKQFMDIFSLPEMALLSCVVDHFLGHGLEFDQAHLYKDVTDAIRDVHVKGLMYQWIERDMGKGSQGPVAAAGAGTGLALTTPFSPTPRTSQRSTSCEGTRRSPC